MAERPKDTLTAEELAILAQAEAEKAERERFNGDRVVFGFTYTDRIYVITAMGRMFCRVLDPRHYNTDGRQTEKTIWRQVEGPF